MIIVISKDIFLMKYFRLMMNNISDKIQLYFIFVADVNQGTEVAPLFVNNQNLVLHLRRNFVSPTQLEVEQVPERIFEMEIGYSWLSCSHNWKWSKFQKKIFEMKTGYSWLP